MIDYPAPQNDSPQALYKWAMDLLQRFSLEEQRKASSNENSSTYMPGHRIAWGGATIPEGWLWENGQILDKLSYPGLFGVYGNRYSLEDDPEGTFRLPDTRGRVPMYLEGEEEFYGGESEVFLTEDHLPEVELEVTDPGHTHEFSGSPHTHGVTDPGHTHATVGGVAINAGSAGVTTGSTNRPLTSGGALVISSAVTGVTVNSATAEGTNAQAETGITVKLNGKGEAVALTPPWFYSRWIVKI